jgi:hypothetical protein
MIGLKEGGSSAITMVMLFFEVSAGDVFGWQAARLRKMTAMVRKINERFRTDIGPPVRLFFPSPLYYCTNLLQC